MAGEKLTKVQVGVLRFIVANGPGTPPLTKGGRVPAQVQGLIDGGLLEKLNSMPGPLMLEIPAAGRQALQEASDA